MTGILNLIIGSLGSKFTIIQTFTATSTWTCPTGVTEVEYLVVAGGGGGGAGIGGGGGAGGYRTGTGLTVTPNNNYTITVGAGQPGGSAGTTQAGTDGQNSSIAQVEGSPSFTTITAVGGGGGGSGGNAPTGPGRTGGSGGGGGYNYPGGAASTSQKTPRAGRVECNEFGLVGGLGDAASCYWPCWVVW